MPPSTITTEDRDTQQPSDTAEAKTTSEDRKPAPIATPETSPQDDDEATEVDDNTIATLDPSPMINVPAKLNPEIEPNNLPNYYELTDLYNSLQPTFAGMYDIADGDDPRAPLLSYATWIIYLVAMHSTSRSKLLGKEWYTINKDSVKLFHYGMTTALSYTHHADPETIKNDDAARGKALTQISAAMNTLLSAGMGLIENKTRDQLDAVVRNVTTGTMATSTVKKELTAFMAGDVNNKLPASVVNWLRGGAIIKDHENRSPLAPKQKPSKTTSKTATSTTTTSTSTKRKEAASPVTTKDAKKAKRQPPPNSKSPNKTIAFASLPATDKPRTPPSPKTATQRKAQTPRFEPPTLITDDYGPPGYLRVCPYFYLKTARTIRARHEEWLKTIHEHTTIFEDVAKEIADHAKKEALDPDTAVFPIESDERICYMHPKIYDVYNSTLQEGHQDLDIEHAVKFCVKMEKNASCLTLSHKPLYGETTQTVKVASGIDALDEPTFTVKYHYKDAIQRDIDTLRTTWEMKQSAKSSS